jgi:hypothetical protein
MEVVEILLPIHGLLILQELMKVENDLPSNGI